jgi:endothelin-converting enzyme
LFDHLLEIFEPFDLIPAPDAEIADLESEWVGAWDESYTVTDELLQRAESIESIKRSRAFSRPAEDKPVFQLDSEVEVASKVDEERRAKLTKTIAYLHSRGQLPFI